MADYTRVYSVTAVFCVYSSEPFNLENHFVHEKHEKHENIQRDARL
jgi:hypothetical protein